MNEYPLSEEPEGKITEDEQLARHWFVELELAEKDHDPFITNGEKVVREYLNEQEFGSTTTRKRGTNVFWSNVQTVRPAAYSNTPRPDIRRRQQGADRIGRLSAEILENATAYNMDCFDWDYHAGRAVDDRLISGRGQRWIRYEPTFITKKEKVRLSAKKGKLYDAEGNEAEESPKDILSDDEGFYKEQPYQKKAGEKVYCEHVHWKDFRHNRARTWPEVRWVARRSYLTKAELVKHFGNVGNEVRCTHKPEDFKDDEDRRSGEQKRYAKAAVWEIWDKTSKKVFWISDGYKDGALKTEKDPLGLKGFFPCPRPLLATVTSDSILPKADYLFYKDQAEEINNITDRIDALLDSLRVVGVCDAASFTELQYMLEKDNEIIPVRNWATFQKGGGFDGVMQWMPISQIVEALRELYTALAHAQQRMYEVIGIPDTMRGVSNPNEGVKTQQLKSQYAQDRIRTLQRDVERFERDCIALVAEVISEHFSDETLRMASGIDFLTKYTEQEFAAAIELLRDDVTRNYRLDIESDSTVLANEALEREARNEFLGAVTPFLDKAMQVMQVQPALSVTMGEILMFVVRGYKAGRNLEQSFEQALQNIQQAQEQAAQQPKPPDPEMLKVQIEQGKLQIEQQKLQIEGQKMQIDAQKANLEAQIKQAEFGLKQQETQVRIMDEQQQAAKVAAETRAAEAKAAVDIQTAQQKAALEIEKLQADMLAKARELEIKERELGIKEAELMLKRIESEKQHGIQAGDLLVKAAQVETQAKQAETVQRGDQGNR